ncbi:Aste57867_5819 [Aphanomyces stellatus]|uniref:Aste57867_5819 protein n=1 Tax=Aphanomyces stellatus TaxID=120398 RepID=A0A485KDZ0_9STRA|nr:hypothetical protein As57867_005805 [Aphanomyces stellatus]VFT82842.1 Aste57867_5819 [Aphanomyces stellatus]
MLRHLLLQEGVGEKRVKKLEARGIRNMKKMFQKSEWELAHIMDLSVEDLKDLMYRVAMRDSPAPTSVMDMFLQRVSCPSVLRTTIPELDNALCGGIPPAAITEANSCLGKSQFCMMMAVLCALDNPDCAVLYFDSGSNFSAKRLLELTIERLSPRQYATDAIRQSKCEAVAQQIRVVNVENLDRLQTRIRELHEGMPSLHGKMVILDSLATMAKNSSTDMSVAHRQMMLMSVASDLKLLASTYDAYVLTTNHTTTRRDECTHAKFPSSADVVLRWVLRGRIVLPIGSDIVLEKTRTGSAMTVHKAAGAGHITVAFSIQKSGLQPMAFADPVDTFDEFDWDDSIIDALDESVDVDGRMHPIQHASQRELTQESTKGDISNSAVHNIYTDVESRGRQSLFQSSARSREDCARVDAVDGVSGIADDMPMSDSNGGPEDMETDDDVDANAVDQESNNEVDARESDDTQDEGDDDVVEATPSPPASDEDGREPPEESPRVVYDASMVDEIVPESEDEDD